MSRRLLFSCDCLKINSVSPGLFGLGCRQWRRQDFVTRGEVRYGSIGGRVRSPPVPVVLSVYQRGSLLDGLAMYLSCDTKKFHDNESTHIGEVGAKWHL